MNPGSWRAWRTNPQILREKRPSRSAFHADVWKLTGRAAVLTVDCPQRCTPHHATSGRFCHSSTPTPAAAGAVQAPCSKRIPRSESCKFSPGCCARTVRASTCCTPMPIIVHAASTWPLPLPLLHRHFSRCHDCVRGPAVSTRRHDAISSAQGETYRRGRSPIPGRHRLTTPPKGSPHSTSLHSLEPLFDAQCAAAHSITVRMCANWTPILLPDHRQYSTQSAAVSEHITAEQRRNPRYQDQDLPSFSAGQLQ